MLRIRLLGEVGAVAGSTELALGGPRPRALLALLAASFPRACSTAQLVDQLWGDDPPVTARNALQVNVTGLRKALRAHEVTIERVGDGYALRGAVAVDSAEFEEAVAAGRSALRAGDVGYARRRLDEAVGMWQGPPFGGLADPPFAEAARRATEAVRVSALSDLAEAHLRAGEPAGAIRAAELLLRDHPFGESGWVTLALAHYWSGQQDEALAACRRARAVLREELGLDPTRALVDVERQILSHEVPEPVVPTVAARSDTAAPQQQPPLPALPGTVVGRETLVEAVVQAIADGARLVTLTGIGGIGKTTLALAVGHRLARVRFCALATEADVPGALARICRSLDVDGGDDPIPAIGEAMGAGVLLLDNLEQIPDVGVALEELLSRAPALVVLATSRRPTGAPQERAIHVPPLSAESAAELFLAFAERVRPGITAADDGATTRLSELLDGIPLALELAAARVRTLTPRQLLSRIEDRRATVLDPSTAGGRAQGHHSLDGILREAFEALGDPARRVFELLGSVSGLISVELFEETAAGLVVDPLAALEELVACGLVTLDVDGRFTMRGPIREFAHRLGPRPDLDARLVRQAVRLATEAAPQLFGADSLETLKGLRRDEDSLDRGVALAVSTSDHRAAASLAIGLNRFWLLTGRLTEGQAHIERVAAMPGHSDVDAARLALLVGTYASYLSDPATPTLLSQALSRSDSVGLPSDRLVVNAWCCLAAYAVHNGDTATANDAADAAARTAKMSGDAGLVALARDIEGHIATYLRDFERGLATKLQGLADARATHDTYDTINILTEIAEDLLNLGRNDEALAYSDEAFDLSKHLDTGPVLGAILVMRGFILIANDLVPAARGCLLEALRVVHERRPDPLALADCLYALGTCAAHDMDTAQACRLFGAALAMYGERGLTPEDRFTEPLREAHEHLRSGLDANRYATLSLIGSSDPARTVEMLLR